MTRIEKSIPEAIKILSESGIADKQFRVKKEFKGYFASFGASIVLSGLLPAAIFFENEDSGSEAERHKVPLAVLKLLQSRKKNITELQQAKKLSEYLLNARQSNARLVKEVSQAAVSLKIALRTFDLSGEEKTNKHEK